MIDRDGKRHNDVPDILMPRLQSKGWQLVGESGTDLNVTPVADVVEFLNASPVVEEKKSDVVHVEDIKTIEKEPEINSEKPKNKPGRKAKK